MLCGHLWEVENHRKLKPIMYAESGRGRLQEVVAKMYRRWLIMRGSWSQREVQLS